MKTDHSTGRVRTHRARAEMPRERIEHVCQCGNTIRVVIEHYQRVQCKRCDATYWALQPRRNGPLVLFPFRKPIELATDDAVETVTFDNCTI